MLYFNLAPIFKARNIQKPFTFLVESGFSRHSAHAILSDKIKSIKLNYVELLCKVLVCEPNDLLTWIPDNKTKYNSNFPLLKLVEEKNAKGWSDTFSNLPLKDLKEVTKSIQENNITKMSSFISENDTI